MQSSPLNITLVLSQLGDEGAFAIFQRLANAQVERGELRGQSAELTKSQYYSKLSGLVDAGLITRSESTYCLTTFGKVVFNALSQIENGIGYESKLKEMHSREQAASTTSEQDGKSAVERAWEDWVTVISK